MKNKELRILYDELLEREKYLKSLKLIENEPIISELNSIIIRVQQLMLTNF